MKLVCVGCLIADVLRFFIYSSFQNQDWQKENESNLQPCQGNITGMVLSLKLSVLDIKL
jgi:hypothetical protein